MTKKQIGVKDVNGTDIYDGDKVELRISAPHGTHIIVIRGRIQYRGEGIASYGCGYVIAEANGRITFLSSIPKYEKNQLFVIREEQ